MAVAKVTITLDQATLKKVDELVTQKVFPTRNQAIQEAVLDKLATLSRSRFEEECAKLDPTEEKAMAEEGMSELLQEWPEY
jgi:metal-responsive CopG/Arc/MetJ family transcriptional regulator